jgi:hypothetical protein
MSLQRQDRAARYKENSMSLRYWIALAMAAAPAMLAPTAASAHDGPAKVATLLKTGKAWDGTPYPAYRDGPPEITVLRIEIPAHSALAWHHHPVINAAYVEQGRLTVEKHDKQGGPPNRPTTCSLGAGQVLPELVDQVHRGYTGDQPVTLIVFYAGTAGAPITEPDVFPAEAIPAQPAPPCDVPGDRR